MRFDAFLLPAPACPAKATISLFYNVNIHVNSFFDYSFITVLKLSF